MKNVSFAYVTVITNESYILGLKALAVSLQMVGSKYPLVILIPEERFDELKQKIIEAGFATPVKETNGFYMVFKTRPYLSSGDYTIDINDNKHWKETFFKLRVFELVEFDKLVLLDSDMMIIKNIDHLFEKPGFAAANSGNAKWGGLLST